MTSLKNRVVRLTYADEFYMDILPAYSDCSLGGTCILVPDRKTPSLCPSNPAGFIEWFRGRCLLRVQRLLEKAKPVPSQQTVEEKEPLQLGVQLLKRWRDLAFEDQDLAPVSVVLTALAGMYYGGEESVSGALSAILGGIVYSIDLAASRGERTYGMESVKVFGPKGSLLANGVEVLFREAKDRREEAGLEGKPLKLDPLPPGAKNPVSYFVNRIRQDKPIEDPVSAQLNVRVIEVLDAARESLQSGHAEKIKHNSK